MAFKSLAEATAAHDVLLSEKEGLATKLEAATNASAAFEADLATARLSATEAISARDAAHGQVTALTAERNEFKAAAEKGVTDFEAFKKDELTRFKAHLTHSVAGQGVPKPVGSAGPKSDAPAITKAEFDKLTPGQKTEHFRLGGTISDK